MTEVRPIRTQSIEVRRTALVASLGPEPGDDVRELWYVMHGQAMRAVLFLEDFRAIDDGTRLIVAPEALSRYYDGPPAASRDAPVLAIWMTRDERESEIRDYVNYLDDLHAHVTATFGGAPPPVTILGFSQGGATAMRWAAQGNVRAARLIVWESSLPPEVDFAALHARHGHPPFTYVCGDRDKFITPKVLEKQHAVLRDAGVPFRAVGFVGGHRLDDATLQALAAGAGG